MQSNNSSTLSARPYPFKTILLLLIVPLLGGAVIYQSLNLGMELSVMVNVFTIRFLGIFIEAVPFLLLGSVTSGFIEIFIKTEDILRWLPRNRLGAALGGTFLGILFPVCECGVVPVTRRLFTKGLPTSMGIAFLLAAPFMNPIVFASTYIAFGFGPIFISRFVITVIIATTIAVVISKYSEPEDILKLHSMHSMDKIQPKPSHVPVRGKFLRALYLAGDEFFEMGRFLIVGCILAATMQTLIPQESLLALGTGSISSVIFLQILAFILSVCSTVDSFLALAFVNTFTTGAIVGFLSFGPMVDVKSTLMFAGVFKPKIVFYLILLPFMMSLFAGVVINLLMGY